MSLVVNLRDLDYFLALAEQRHFGHAASSCHVSQPTLSAQVRKLEQELGVALFERSNKHVALTPIGESALRHAKDALEAVEQLRTVAAKSKDQLAGPLKLGVIPTLAPYLMPFVLRELRTSAPNMRIDLWEDQTKSLLELVIKRELDAALIATEVAEGQLTSLSLFMEPFLAALPRTHRLAKRRTIDEKDLAKDVLVLSEGHCLGDQTLMACGRQALEKQPLQAASLGTLIQLVAEGYGTTLVPQLAASSVTDSRIVLRRLARGSSRTIRLVSRSTFTRPQALKALEKVIRKIKQRRSSAAQ
ncbi:MAG TPA: LysR substrate-binding domain-containing protein [Terriglobales bacterium]|nr:LysR substrate-binding domain-containing protein [Terriglobales bacterium]